MDKEPLLKPPTEVPAESRKIRGRCGMGTVKFLTATLNAYEGLALVRTKRSCPGWIEIWCMPSAEAEVRRVLREIARRIPFRLEERDD